MRQQLAPFDAHGIGHGQAESIIFSGTDKGQRYSGIAAGRFHNEGFRGDRAIELGGLDHRCGNAVLHTAQGIKKLKFGKYLRICTFLNSIQPHQGRCANGVADNGMIFHGWSPLKETSFVSLFVIGKLDGIVQNRIAK